MGKKTIFKVCLSLTLFAVIAAVTVVMIISKKGNDKREEVHRETIYEQTVEEETFEVEAIHEENKDVYEINTTYGTLYYPLIWKDIVITKIVKEAECEIIEFWFLMEGKEEIHIFDVSFGGEGYSVGTIENSEDEAKNVCVTTYSYEINERWSEEEVALINAAEHDINYILENLSKLNNFISNN